MKKQGHNKKKSNRHWEYSGYKQCDECTKHDHYEFHYDTWTSWRPYSFTLCRACYEYIYVLDRKEQPTPVCPWFYKPTLFE